MDTLTQILAIIKAWWVRETEVSDGSTTVPYQEFTYTIAAGARQDIFAVFSYFRVLSLSASTLSIKLGQNGLETPFTGQGLGADFKSLFNRVTLINTGGVPMTITVALADGRINDDRLNVAGSISVGSIVPGTGATNLGKAEDSPSADGDTGVGVLAVRNDLLANANASAVGDYTFMSADNRGAVFVRPSQRALAAYQTSVGTGAAVQLVTTNQANGEILISSGATDLYINSSNAVTTANGFLIPAGSTFSINNMGDIWGIRATGTSNAYMLVGQS